MEQEAAQELFDSKSHESFPVAVCGVAPAEGDVAVGEIDQSGVGDGNAMGVGAEIAQHVGRSSEGGLGVDDPVVAEQHPEPGSEGTWLSKWQKVAVELECASMECVAKSFDELAAEDFAEHIDGQKEGSAGGDPGCVIRRESAGGKYAMDMRMKLQALIPAMQHAEEADLGAKMLWIASDLEQGLGAGMKEQLVDEPLVLECEQGQFPRQGEDGMDIACGQQFPLARLKPAQARVALASGTMPVSARNGELSITCLMGSFLLWRVRRQERMQPRVPGLWNSPLNFDL